MPCDMVDGMNHGARQARGSTVASVIRAVGSRGSDAVASESHAANSLIGSSASVKSPVVNFTVRSIGGVSDIFGVLAWTVSRPVNRTSRSSTVPAYIVEEGRARLCAWRGGGSDCRVRLRRLQPVLAVRLVSPRIRPARFRHRLAPRNPLICRLPPIWPMRGLRSANCSPAAARTPASRAENPATGARGTVTPIATAYPQGEVTCHDFLASYVKGASQSWLQGEACKPARARARPGKSAR